MCLHLGDFKRGRQALDIFLSVPNLQGVGGAKRKWKNTDSQAELETDAKPCHPPPMVDVDCALAQTRLRYFTIFFLAGQCTDAHI